MKSLKKISSLFCVLVFSAITLASCDDDDDKSVLRFNPDKVEVEVGKTVIVTASGGTAPYTVTPSDPKIATAKADKSSITITGVKKGTVNIAVSDKDKNSGMISVTVKDVAGGLDFDKKTVEVGVGKTVDSTIKGGVSPYAAESKDKSIASATVKDNKVTIQGVKAGKTDITVTDKDKKNSGTISVTVK